jgi:ABC-type nitrate/sulfonate/bicarbonate transport system substrate-binding protein
MSRKKPSLVAVVIVIVAFSALSGYLLVSQTTTPRSLVKVTRYIAGLTDNEATFYAADMEGFFAQNGLAVNQIVMSGPAAIQALAADRTSLSFVWSSLINILLIQSQNPNSTELISVASTGHKNPISLQYLQSSGISKPSDLVGKVVGSPSTGLTTVMFQDLLRRDGLLDKVRIQPMTGAALIPALLSKKVDAIVRYADNFGTLSADAKKINEEARQLFLSDYGEPPSLGQGIIVQKKLVMDNPDIVRRIVNATMQAMRFCVIEPATCMSDFVKANPTFNFTESLADFHLFIDVDLGPPFNDPESVVALTALQLGWHNPKEMAQIVEFAKQMLGISLELSPESVYTNQFVVQP